MCAAPFLSVFLAAQHDDGKTETRRRHTTHKKKEEKQPPETKGEHAGPARGKSGIGLGRKVQKHTRTLVLVPLARAPPRVVVIERTGASVFVHVFAHVFTTSFVYAFGEKFPLAPKLDRQAGARVVGCSHLSSGKVEPLEAALRDTAGPTIISHNFQLIRSQRAGDRAREKEIERMHEHKTHVSRSVQFWASCCVRSILCCGLRPTPKSCALCVPCYRCVQTLATYTHFTLIAGRVRGPECSVCLCAAGASSRALAGWFVSCGATTLPHSLSWPCVHRPPTSRWHRKSCLCASCAWTMGARMQCTDIVHT